MRIEKISKEEFEKAVRMYSDDMLRCAYAYCGSRADSEDVVQEAFVRYLKKAPQFSDEAHRKAWLLRVVINLSKNLRKSFWYRNKTELDENVPEQSDALAGAEIWTAVRQLPPKYRIVIELYYNAGYTIEETAALTGSKRSTVSDRLAKAKAMLKEILKEE